MVVDRLLCCISIALEDVYMVGFSLDLGSGFLTAKMSHFDVQCLCWSLGQVLRADSYVCGTDLRYCLIYHIIPVVLLVHKLDKVIFGVLAVIPTGYL